MADKKININVGYTIDKSGLEEMQSYFQRIANQAAEPGKNLTAELKKAGQTAQTLDGILEKTFNTNLGTLNVTKFNQELQKSGLTIKSVQADLTAVGSDGVIAYNRLAQAILGTNIQLKQTSQTLDKMFVTFKNTIRYGISSSIFNNFANSIQRAYNYTKNLDTSLNNIRIVTEKSANEMDRFAEKANKAAKVLNASTLDYTNAALIYYQQGLSDQEVQARAETTVKVANVTGQTGREVSEQLTAVWNGYKVSAEETEVYVDKLAAVAATTAADLQELSIGMSKVASAANVMGVDFDDLNAQIATIVSVTRQAPESVGTALKTIYARLGDLKVDGVDEFGVKLGEITSQMHTMGIEILDQNGNMRDMTSVMAEVAEKWTTWTSAQRQAAAVAMAGKRQYNNLIALFDNWDKYTDALNTSIDALGTLQKQQDIFTESTEAKLNKLKATWEDLYKSIGDTKTIQFFITTITNAVQTLDNFSDSLGGGLKTLGAFGITIANIFSKQIARGISNATIRMDALSQNLILIKSIQSTIDAGIANRNNMNLYEKAATANTQEQVEIAERIHKVRAGMSEEEQNLAIEYQKQLGLLKEQEVLLKGRVESTASKAFNKEETDEISKAGYSDIETKKDTLDEIIDQKTVLLDKDEKELKNLEKQVKEINNLYKEYKKVGKEVKNQSERKKQQAEVEQQLISKLEQVGIKNATITNFEGEITEKLKEQINLQEIKIDSDQSEIEKLQKQSNVLNTIAEQKSEIYEISLQQNSVEQQLTGLEERAKKIQMINQVVTVTLGSLSSMAMAWSSINSLMKTWSDDATAIGDKISQSILAVSFTLPMLTANFKNLGKAFNITTGAVSGLIAKKKILALAGQKVANVEEAIEIIEAKNILSKTKLAEVTNKYTTSIWGASAATKSLMLSLGAIAAAAASVAAVVIWYNKYQEAKLKEAQATIDANKEKQKEIDLNKELYGSYQKAYDQYQKGISSKEELGKVAEELAKKYHLEGIELAKLTGQYENLNNSIKNARSQELEEGIENAVDSEWALGQKLNRTARKGLAGHIVHSDSTSKAATGLIASNVMSGMATFGLAPLVSSISSFINRNNEDYVTTGHEGLDAFEVDFGGDLGKFRINNIDDPRQMLALYDEISEKIKDISPTTNAYKDASKWLEQMKEAAEETRAVFESEKSMMTELQFNSFNIDNVQSVEEYEEKVAKLRNTLRVVYNDEKEIEIALENHFKDSGNEFIQAGRKIEAIRSIFKNWTDEQWNYLRNKFSSNDLIEIASSNKINLSDLINYTPEQVQKIFELVQEEIDQQDIEIVVSLRAKITSDKKLTKTELEELLGEESKLLQDDKYGALFNDFDNMSSLEQLELLNDIIADRINLSKEWERTQKETYTELIKAEEEYQSHLQAEKRVLDEQKHRAQDDSQRRKIELEIAEINSLIDESAKKIEDFSYKMSQTYFNEVRFDNLISGIDGVITEAKVLKDLTSAIGENWIIATDKIENFAKNFPELLSSQKNYNLLQDGSLQLTEEGQAAFEKIKEARKEEIILQNEAYKNELKITADKKLAEYEYYKNMANTIEQSIALHEDESITEQKLKKNLEEFKVRMMNITGQSDDELNRIIQENSNLTTANVVANVEEQYRAYQQLASAIVACTEGKTVPPWQTNRASAPPVETAGHEIKATIDFLPEGLSEEDKKKLAKRFRESAEVAYDEYSTAISKIASADAQTNALLGQLNGTGKSKDKNKKDKDLKDEFDRYYDIKNAITLVGNALERVGKIQEKVHGKELIQSLKNENKLIKQQAQNYELLYSQQQDELAELKNTLSGYGFNFDENNFLTNYDSVTESMLENYQAAINKGLSDEQRQIWDNSYNDFKENLERYNTLFYSEMKDTQDKLSESNRKIMENNLKMWETELKVKLDFEEARRTWIDFLKDISYDFRLVYKDLIAEASHFALKMETYSGLGTIETDLNAIKDIILEIDKINSGHGSDMFESISDAQEKLKELDSQLEEDAKNMKQLWEDAWETYLDGIDQTKDKLDDLDEQFERINEELDFQSKLIELLYGDEAYKMLDALYKGQEKYAENQITSIKAQADLWHQLWVESGATLENQSTWTEDQKRYYEQWGEAQTALNESVTNYIELLKTDYLNAVNDVLKSLEAALTGSSLKDIETQWGRITKDTDKYYDSIEQAYEAQKFANKIDQEIAKTTNIKNQQKLMALRDREVNYLREKANLTKYDLDAAEARYQIAVKEMALEDARQNKTSMKLVRNEQGNWSYQYMADMDDVEAKQDDILQSYGDLYKLAGDAYQDNLSALQSLQSEYLESAREIYENMYLSEQEKEIKLEELRTYYYDQYSKLAEENQLYRNDLATAGAGLLLQIYQQDEEAYQYMTNSEQSMLDILINSSIENYQDLQDKATENYNNIGAASTKLMEEVRSDWSASAQFIAEAWNADNGVSVKAQIVSANERITQATNEYEEKVNECANRVEADFGEQGIKGSIDRASKATDNLRDRTEIMVNDSKIFVNGLKDVVDKLGDAWGIVYNKVQAAIGQMENYLSIVGKVQEVSAQLYNTTGGQVDLSTITELLRQLVVGDRGNDTLASPKYIVEDLSSGALVSNIYDYKSYAERARAGVSGMDDSRYGVRTIKTQSELDKILTMGYKPAEFATGGYTGDWSDGGKLAFLHQKELVLNQEDTSNFLKGVSLLRDMAALNGSIERSIAASIGAMALQFSGNGIGNIGTPSGVANNIGGDTYYVTAEFPNATDVDEIRQAILNLPNIVSQHTNKNLY